MLNTATDMGNAGPDFKYGWGHLNARRAFNSLKNNQFFINSIDNDGNNQEVLTEAEVATDSIIEGKKAGLKDLTGLEKCIALASLTLPENQITNLATIKGLERLQFLVVFFAAESDLHLHAV